ncbi:uncharacterized protein AC631_06014, partial [Debaryomyces fabryi]
MSKIPRNISSFGPSSSLQPSFSSVPGIKATAELPGLSTPPSSPEMEVADTVMEDAVDTDMEDVVIPLDLTLPSTPRASSVLVPMPSHPETPLASSPLSVPQVVEPPSPSSSPASSRLLSSRTVIEYISDSEASVSGEDYRTSYYERHHDNFDCSDDEDYIDKPIKKRKAITGKLRRRSE